MVVRTLIQTSTIVLCLVGGIGQSWAEEYLSNLGDLWPDPTGNTMGDIEVLIGPYGPFVVQFFTGSGTNEMNYITMSAAIATNSANAEAFNLTSVTFEFLGSPWQPWSNWSNVTIEVSQQVSNQSIVLGQLGNAVVNPTPTQWPTSTTYIDFHPITDIVLQPSSEYSVALSVPFNYPPILGLLFTYSPQFVTPTDWRLGATMTRVPIYGTEYLKIAIGADAIVETNSMSLPVSPVSHVSLAVSKAGSKIVLSWPASTIPCQLYAMPSIAPAAWTPVLVEPITNNDNFVVTLPLTGPDCYFRLQAQ
jgi:hypothetical protein